MNWLSRKTARSRLGVSEPVFNALIRSGLLGYTLSTTVSDQAVLSYQRFGTQWEIDERYGPGVRMMADATYDNLPPIEGIGPQPPATRAHGFIYPPSEQNPQGLERNDTGWIAHFYLVPNYFYFPDPTELALVWC